MAGGNYSLITFPPCCDEDEEYERYTQRPNWRDRARSHEELESDKVRSPDASEGCAFIEKCDY